MRTRTSEIRDGSTSDHSEGTGGTSSAPRTGYRGLAGAQILPLAGGCIRTDAQSFGRVPLRPPVPPAEAPLPNELPSSPRTSSNPFGAGTSERTRTSRPSSESSLQTHISPTIELEPTTDRRARS
jgi:hypothetical protein